MMDPLLAKVLLTNSEFSYSELCHAVRAVRRCHEGHCVQVTSAFEYVNYVFLFGHKQAPLLTRLAFLVRCA